jgi:hypothetical protein
MDQIRQALVERRTVSLGETIFREGTPSDHIYLIESGIVRLERHEGGDWIEVARLGANNILGETALIERRVHSLRAIAETDVTVAVLSNQPFIRALKQLDPAISVILTGMVRKLEVATGLYTKLKAAEEHAAEANPPPKASAPEPGLFDADEEPAAEAVPVHEAPAPAATPPAPRPSSSANAIGAMPLHHPSEYYSFAALHPAAAASGAPRDGEERPAVAATARRRRLPVARPRWWQWVAIAVVVAAGVYVGVGGLNVAGPSEAEFRAARMALDDAADSQGRTVSGFIQCLANHGRGALDPPNPVSVTHGYGADFLVKSTLRSDTIFHFLMQNRPGGAVAVMERVEYLVPDHGYAQAIDLVAKQQFATLACE